MNHRTTEKVRALRALAIAALAAAGAAYAPSAEAQTSSADAAAAQDLFDRAKGLVGKGDYAGACPKFEESQRLDPEPGTEYNLADCYEHLGRTASAWVAFVDVADQLRTKGDAAREKVARDRAAALQPKLTRLQITVPPDARVTGLVVKRDGDVVREAQWGIGVPVDPGSHTLTADAPGMLPWTEQVATTGPGNTATATVPKLSPAPVATTPPPVHPPPTVATTGGGSSTLATSADGAKPGSTQRLVGLVIGGVGIAALLVGGYFGIQSFSKHGTYTDECPNNVCKTPQGISDHDDAVSDGNISTIAMGAGAAAVAVGAVLYLLAPSASATPTRGEIRAVPLVGAGTGGLAVRGAF